MKNIKVLKNLFTGVIAAFVLFAMAFMFCACDVGNTHISSDDNTEELATLTTKLNTLSTQLSAAEDVEYTEDSLPTSIRATEDVKTFGTMTQMINEIFLPLGNFDKKVKTTPQEMLDANKNIKEESVKESFNDLNTPITYYISVLKNKITFKLYFNEQDMYTKVIINTNETTGEFTTLEAYSAYPYGDKNQTVRKLIYTIATNQLYCVDCYNYDTDNDVKVQVFNEVYQEKQDFKADLVA